MTTAARRSAACFVRDELKVSQRRACGLIGISESSYRYCSIRTEMPELKEMLLQLAPPIREWKGRARRVGRAHAVTVFEVR